MEVLGATVAQYGRETPASFSISGTAMTCAMQVSALRSLAVASLAASLAAAPVTLHLASPAGLFIKVSRAVAKDADRSNSGSGSSGSGSSRSGRSDDGGSRGSDSGPGSDRGRD